MPKFRTRRTKTLSHARAIAWSNASAPGDRRWNYAIAAAVVVGIAYGTYAWWTSAEIERAFQARATEGETLLKNVESVPSDGRAHLSPGQPYTYRDRFPTSGPHGPRWTPPGLYDARQPATQLVHALEHGNVVVYYDAPGSEAMQMLEAWADLYDGMWSGLVVTPMSGLGEAVVLTAWTKRFRLDRFDPAAAAAFIDAYRGRGPENRVR